MISCRNFVIYLGAYRQSDNPFHLQSMKTASRVTYRAQNPELHTKLVASSTRLFGRVRNQNFEYYHLPSSMDVPTMTIAHQETPSPYTPYGIKGAGEGGRMLTPAILSAAIEDALEPYGVRITSLPITAEQIVEWAASR